MDIAAKIGSPVLSEPFADIPVRSGKNDYPIILFSGEILTVFCGFSVLFSYSAGAFA